MSVLTQSLPALRNFGSGVGNFGMSTASGMGSNLINSGQMGSTVGMMSQNVHEQEAMMDQITQLQNELNLRMALDQLIKQAGANAKTLTQG